jgi:50S ribosomal subunit-associated GTPase HflX
VADGSSPRLADQIEAVDQVLDDLVPAGIPRQLVINKLDAVSSEADRLALHAQHPGAWFISAHDPESVGALRAKLSMAGAEWAITHHLGRAARA